MSCTSTSRAILNAAAISHYIPHLIWWFPNQNSGSYSESLCVAHALKNYCLPEIHIFNWHPICYLANSHSLRNTAQLVPLQFLLHFLKSHVASVRYSRCYVGKQWKGFGYVAWYQRLGNREVSVNFGQWRSGRNRGHVEDPGSTTRSSPTASRIATALHLTALLQQMLWMP